MEDTEIEYLEEYKDFVLPGIKTSSDGRAATSAASTGLVPRQRRLSSDSSGSSSIDPDIFQKLFDGKFLDDEMLTESSPNAKAKSQVRRRLSSYSSDSNDALDALYNRRVNKVNNNRRDRLDSYDSIDDLGDALMGATHKTLAKKANAQLSKNSVSDSFHRGGSNQLAKSKSAERRQQANTSSLPAAPSKQTNSKTGFRANGSSSSSCSSNAHLLANKKKAITIIKAQKPDLKPPKHEPKEDPLNLKEYTDDADSDMTYEYESDFYGYGDSEEDDDKQSKQVIDISTDSNAATSLADTVTPVVSEDESERQQPHTPLAADERLQFYLNNLSSAETPPSKNKYTSYSNDRKSRSNEKSSSSTTTEQQTVKKNNDDIDQLLPMAEKPQFDSGPFSSSEHLRRDSDIMPRDRFVDDDNLMYETLGRVSQNLAEEIINIDMERSIEFEKRSGSKSRSTSVSKLASNTYTHESHVRKLTYSNDKLNEVAAPSMRRVKSDEAFQKCSVGRQHKNRAATTEEESKSSEVLLTNTTTAETAAEASVAASPSVATDRKPIMKKVKRKRGRSKKRKNHSTTRDSILENQTEQSSVPLSETENRTEILNTAENINSNESCDNTVTSTNTTKELNKENSEKTENRATLENLEISFNCLNVHAETEDTTIAEPDLAATQLISSTAIIEPQDVFNESLEKMEPKVANHCETACENETNIEQVVEECHFENSVAPAEIDTSVVKSINNKEGKSETVGLDNIGNKMNKETEHILQEEGSAVNNHKVKDKIEEQTLDENLNTEQGTETVETLIGDLAETAAETVPIKLNENKREDSVVEATPKKILHSTHKSTSTIKRSSLRSASAMASPLTENKGISSGRTSRSGRRIFEDTPQRPSSSRRSDKSPLGSDSSANSRGTRNIKNAISSDEILSTETPQKSSAKHIPKESSSERTSRSCKPSTSASAKKYLEMQKSEKLVDKHQKKETTTKPPKPPKNKNKKVTTASAKKSHSTLHKTNAENQIEKEVINSALPSEIIAVANQDLNESVTVMNIEVPPEIIEEVKQDFKESLNELVTEMNLELPPEVPLNEPATEMIEVPLNEPASEMIEVPLNEPASEMIEVPLNEPATEMIEVPLNEPATEMIEVPSEIIEEPQQDLNETLNKSMTEMNIEVPLAAEVQLNEDIQLDADIPHLEGATAEILTTQDVSKQGHAITEVMENISEKLLAKKPCKKKVASTKTPGILSLGAQQLLSDEVSVRRSTRSRTETPIALPIKLARSKESKSKSKNRIADETESTLKPHINVKEKKSKKANKKETVEENKCDDNNASTLDTIEQSEDVEAHSDIQQSNETLHIKNITQSMSGNAIPSCLATELEPIATEISIPAQALSSSTLASREPSTCSSQGSSRQLRVMIKRLPTATLCQKIENAEKELMNTSQDARTEEAITDPADQLETNPNEVKVPLVIENETSASLTLSGVASILTYPVDDKQEMDQKEASQNQEERKEEQQLRQDAAKNNLEQNIVESEEKPREESSNETISDEVPKTFLRKRGRFAKRKLTTKPKSIRSETSSVSLPESENTTPLNVVESPSSQVTCDEPIEEDAAINNLQMESEQQLSAETTAEKEQQQLIEADPSSVKVQQLNDTEFEEQKRVEDIAAAGEDKLKVETETQAQQHLNEEKVDAENDQQLNESIESATAGDEKELLEAENLEQNQLKDEGQLNQTKETAAGEDEKQIEKDAQEVEKPEEEGPAAAAVIYQQQNDANDNEQTNHTPQLESTETTGVMPCVDDGSDVDGRINSSDVDTTQPDEAIRREMQGKPKKASSSSGIMAPPAPPKRDLPTGKAALRRAGRSMQMNVQPTQKRRKLEDTTEEYEVGYTKYPTHQKQETKEPIVDEVPAAKSMAKKTTSPVIKKTKSLPKESAHPIKTTVIGKKAEQLKTPPVKTSLTALLSPDTEPSTVVDNSVIITTSANTNQSKEPFKKLESPAGINISVSLVPDHQSPPKKSVTQAETIKKIISLKAGKKDTPTAAAATVEKSFPADAPKASNARKTLPAKIKAPQTGEKTAAVASAATVEKSLPADAPKASNARKTLPAKIKAPQTSEKIAAVALAATVEKSLPADAPKASNARKTLPAKIKAPQTGEKTAAVASAATVEKSLPADAPKASNARKTLPAKIKAPQTSEKIAAVASTSEQAKKLMEKESTKSKNMDSKPAKSPSTLTNRKSMPAKNLDATVTNPTTIDEINQSVIVASAPEATATEVSSKKFAAKTPSKAKSMELLLQAEETVVESTIAQVNSTADTKRNARTPKPTNNKRATAETSPPEQPTQQPEQLPERSISNERQQTTLPPTATQLQPKPQRQPRRPAKKTLAKEQAQFQAQSEAQSQVAVAAPAQASLPEQTVQQLPPTRKRKAPAKFDAETGDVKRRKQQPAKANTNIAFPVLITAAVAPTHTALPKASQTVKRLTLPPQPLPPKMRKLRVRLNRKIVKNWLRTQQQQQQQRVVGKASSAVKVVPTTVLSAPAMGTPVASPLAPTRRVTRLPAVKAVPLPVLEIKSEQDDVDVPQPAGPETIADTISDSMAANMTQSAGNNNLSTGNDLISTTISCTITTEMNTTTTSASTLIPSASSASAPNSIGTTKLYSYLYPTRCQRNYGQVGLDFCCPNLDGPMEAIDPVRLHEVVEEPVLELPQYLVMTTKIVSEQDMNIPQKVRAKLEQLVAKDGRPKVVQPVQKTTTTSNATPATAPTISPLAAVAPVAPVAAPVIDKNTKQLPRGTKLPQKLLAINAAASSASAPVPAPVPAAALAPVLAAAPGPIPATAPAPTAALAPTVASSPNVTQEPPERLHLPPICPLDRQRMELQTRVEHLDAVVQSLVKRASTLTVTERQQVIEKIVKTSTLEPIDVIVATKLLENYIRYINAVTNTVTAPIPVLRPVVIPATTTATLASTSVSASASASASNSNLALNTTQAQPAASMSPAAQPEAILRAPLGSSSASTSKDRRPIYDKEKNIIGYQYQSTLSKPIRKPAASGRKSTLPVGTPVATGTAQQQQRTRDSITPTASSSGKTAAVKSVAKPATKRSGSVLPFTPTSNTKKSFPQKTAAPDKATPVGVVSGVPIIATSTPSNRNVIIVNQLLSQPEECILPDAIVGIVDAATEIKGELDDAEMII